MPGARCVEERLLRLAIPSRLGACLADEVLVEEIRLVHDQSRQTYGYRRVTAELVDGRGREVGRHRVARLMAANAIQGVTRRRFCRTTRRDDSGRPAPDILERDFSATAPDRRWVADITYVPTWAGFVFLAVVIDVFSRRVVGWSMSSNQRTELVTRALQMAVAQRQPDGVVVHHSDQGCQYTSYDFAVACRAAGVERSMGSVGDCFDNAMAESFFATLECELIDRSVFENRGMARMAVFDFIECFYNSWRRHSSVGHLAPAEFERRWRATQVLRDAA